MEGTNDLEQAMTTLNMKLQAAEREVRNLRELNEALQECCNRKARIEKRLCEAIDENDRLKAELKELKGERR